METEKRDSLIHRFGRELARHLPGFHGKIRYNICAGKYVNANVDETILSKKENNNGKGSDSFLTTE